MLYYAYHKEAPKPYSSWVVVKIMVPFWVPSIIRHRVFRYQKRGPNFDNNPVVKAPTLSGARIASSGIQGPRISAGVLHPMMAERASQLLMKGRSCHV